MKILIIDGVSSLRNILGDFSLSRFQAEWAVGGPYVLSRIAEFKPSVILMDMAFSDIDGLTLLEKITLKFPHTKIIVLTQFFRETFRDKFYASVEELQKNIDNWLDYYCERFCDSSFR